MAAARRLSTPPSSCGEAARFRERQGLVQCTSGEAERGRSDRHAEQVQRFHGDAEAFARLADDRVGGDADIAVLQSRQRVRGDYLDPLRELDCVAGYDE